jgi:hypothetical protein
LAAKLSLDPAAPVEPRFSLAAKGLTQQRSVH